MKWIKNKIEEPTECFVSGVYRILLYKKGKPYTIKRLNSEDTKGILSIGKSINIEKRRKLFLKTSEGLRKKGHSEGRTWFIVNRLKNSFFDGYSLFFEYIETENPEQKERDELKKYFEKYFELPPLNHQFPGRMEWYSQLR